LANLQVNRDLSDVNSTSNTTKTHMPPLLSSATHHQESDIRDTKNNDDDDDNDDDDAMIKAMDEALTRYQNQNMVKDQHH